MPLAGFQSAASRTPVTSIMSRLRSLTGIARSGVAVGADTRSGDSQATASRQTGSGSKAANRPISARSKRNQFSSCQVEPANAAATSKIHAAVRLRWRLQATSHNARQQAQELQARTNQLHSRAGSAPLANNIRGA